MTSGKKIKGYKNGMSIYNTNNTMEMMIWKRK